MKTKSTTILKAILVCLLMFSLRTFATNVSGHISSNTIWTLANSPYIVTGNVLLDSGFTLTIQPGVIVKFDTLTCLQIGGTLTAIGTSLNPITFTSNQTSPVQGYWGYILFNNTSTDYDTNTHTGSIMQYCIVEYGANQTVENGGGAIVAGNWTSLALPFIDNCIVRNNATAGICLEGTARLGALLRVTNCDVYDNGYTSYMMGNGVAGGIYASIGVPGTYPTFTGIISGNKIHGNYSGNGGGINCSAGGGNSNNIFNNIIYNNTATNEGGGIIGIGYSVYNNIIYNNTSSSGAAISFQGAGTGSVFDNIIVNNTATSSNSLTSDIMDVSWGSYSHNHFIDNNSKNYIIWSQNSATINYNTITRNITTHYPPTQTLYDNSSDLSSNFQHNNLYGNTATYEFWNHDAIGTNVNAKYCWWNTISTHVIDSLIWDYSDDGSLSTVNYVPFQTSPDTLAPVTPPVHVVKTDLGGGKIKVSWYANLETDLAGYKVYWGSATGYSFANSINVGNKLIDTLTGVSITDTIAVTAYSNKITGANDQFNGYESWYTYAIGKPSPAFSANPVSICPGDTVYFTANTPDLFPYAFTTWSWSFPSGMPAVSSTQNPKVIYYTPGNYNVKLIVSNIAGSDSLTLTNYINVKSPSYDTISPLVCNLGQYTSPSGLYMWYSSGIYHDTIPNHAGCDSLLTIKLKLSNNSYSNISPQACNSYTSPSGNHTWTVGGGYYDTIPNLEGCDSIISINLTVTIVDTSITIVGNTLTANAVGTYQWLNCSGYSIIPGETNQSFTPTMSGNYAVSITQNGCTDTSSCYYFLIFGIKEFTDGSSLIYPNPAHDNFIVKLDNSLNGKNNIRLKIFDLPGRELNNIKIKNNEVISRDGLSNGIYFYKLFSGEDLLQSGKIVLE